MKKAVNPLLRKYRGKPVILDTNVLLLYWCTSFDSELVKTFKRLNSFSHEDIQLLHRTLEIFPSLSTTPHVLAEVSSLANALPQWRKEGWTGHFVRQIEVTKEEWISAKKIVRSPAISLGLTDAALCALASTHVIITIDFPLSNFLESKRLNVINFNHLRDVGRYD